MQLPTKRTLPPLLVIVCLLVLAAPVLAAEEVMPKHITPNTLKAVRLGLDYLARTQASDGGWHDEQAGQAYPVAVAGLAGTALLANGNTVSRGRYAQQVERALDFLLSTSTSSGLLTGPGEDNGRPMHGHGFALMFLASAYGTETKPALRDKTKIVIDKAVKLTAEGQSRDGGWTYTPGSGDEGSVTVTQVQALRAAHNAGLAVPRGTISEAVQYIERCSTSEGGICYSLHDLGRRRGHALQRRSIRRAGGESVLGVRLAPLQSHQELEQRLGSRLLLPPVCLAGLLFGGRQILGRILSRRAGPVDFDARQERRIVVWRRDRQTLWHGDRADHFATALQVLTRLSTLARNPRECRRT